MKTNKTKLLRSLMFNFGLLFCASILLSIAMIIINLNFWYLLLPLLFGSLATLFGIKFTKHVEQDPNKAIENLKK